MKKRIKIVLKSINVPMLIALIVFGFLTTGLTWAGTNELLDGVYDGDTLVIVMLITLMVICLTITAVFIVSFINDFTDAYRWAKKCYDETCKFTNEEMEGIWDKWGHEVFEDRRSQS